MPSALLEEGLDNGIIDPRDTRKVLGFLLETCKEKSHRKLNPNTFWHC